MSKENIEGKNNANVQKVDNIFCSESKISEWKKSVN